MSAWSSAGKVKGLFENTIPSHSPLPPKLPSVEKRVKNVEGTESEVPPFNLASAIESRLTNLKKAPWSTRKKWFVGIGVLFLLGLLYSSSRPNAQCPVCAHEFFLTERFKGNISEWTRQFPCEKCGIYSPAGVFYKRGASPPPDPLSDMLEPYENTSNYSDYY